MPRKTGSERLKEDKKTKLVFHFVDKKNQIDVKSREAFKRSTKQIHFPFYPSSGDPKYNKRFKLTFEDTSKGIPVGFLKKASTGYGFNRGLRNLAK